jgi:hypothetical protein
MRKLLFLILLGAGLWSGYWFVGAGAIRQEVEDGFADATAQGLVAQRSALKIAGFPNRFDVTVEGLSLANAQQSVSWQAPFVQVFAMTWKPWHIIAAFPPDQQVSLSGEVIDVTSDDLKASLRAKPSTDLPLAEARLAGAALGLTSGKGWTLGLGEFTLAFRQEPAFGDAAYELGFDLAPLTPDPGFVAAVRAVTVPDLPPSDLPEAMDSLWGSVYLTFSAPLDRHAGDTNPLLTRIEINQLNIAWGELAISSKGLIEADQQGYAAGRVTVEVTNWDRLPAILVAAGAITPEFAPTVARGMQALAAQTPEPTVLSLSLVLEDGRMSFGPFPLGPAPLMVPPSG